MTSADHQQHNRVEPKIVTDIHRRRKQSLEGRLHKRHPPRCPVGFVAGQRSKEMRVGGLAATTALAGLRLRWIDGTHLYPMEKPAQTAALVLKLLGSMA